MQTYEFTFRVTTDQGVTAAEALSWLHRTLEEVDVELPDAIESVQTYPTVKVTEGN